MTIQIGALGALNVTPGTYIYVGSAFGPGGLSGRLQHHLRPAVHPHWHIDYLRQATEVTEIWYSVSSERLECTWARQLGAMPETSIPLKKFGASDCGCPAHLFFCSHNDLA